MRGVLALGMRQRAQIPEYALLGVFAYRAGIEYHNVRLVRVVRERKAHIFQHPRQPFAVGDVLLTSERIHQRDGVRLPFRELLAYSAFVLPLTLQLRRRDFSDTVHVSASRHTANIFGIISQRSGKNKRKATSDFPAYA